MMRAPVILFMVVAAVVAKAQDTAPKPPPPPAPRPVKVECYWGEGQMVPGLTVDKGVVWSESGDRLYLHKQPVLSNQDVVKVEISKTVFGVGALAEEHFTAKFHLTAEARKRLAETCGPRGEKMLSVFVDGRNAGHPFYLKSRDERNFVPFAGMFTSKDLADRIAATFAKPEKVGSP